MLLAVDKPNWITSYDVVHELKRLFLKQKTCLPVGKVWHSGTLDPMASGLMIVGIWNDTKKLNEIQWLDKTYIATIDFSKSSDTRDLQYRKEIKNFELGILNWWKKYIIKDWKKITAPNLDEIKEKLKKLIPSYNLPLTPFSAKKKNWKKFYELAREWNGINENREMKVNSFQIIDYNFPELRIEIDVGSWTYIRSIAYRLGNEFGLGWILTKLRRTKIGKWDINDFEMKNIDGTKIKTSDKNILL